MIVKDPNAIPDKWGKRPSDRSLGELLEGGMLTFGSGAPVVMFVCVLAILITLIVKTVRNGKEAEE